MDKSTYEFSSELWRHPGEAGWCFVTLPEDIADDIDAAVGVRAGFGSIPVVVSVGATSWKTSLFPDSSSDSFVLPMKKAIREAQQLEVGETVSVQLRHDTDRAAQEKRSS